MGQRAGATRPGRADRHPQAGPERGRGVHSRRPQRQTQRGLPRALPAAARHPARLLHQHRHLGLARRRLSSLPPLVHRHLPQHGRPRLRALASRMSRSTTRTLGVGCTLIALLGFLASASAATARGLTAAQASALPDRYLVTTYNPKVNVTKPGNIVEKVEILDGHGHLVRLVAQGRYGVENARSSPNDKMISWIDPRGLHVENLDGSGRRLLVAASTHCTVVCVGMSYAWAPNS